MFAICLPDVYVVWPWTSSLFTFCARFLPFFAYIWSLQVPVHMCIRCTWMWFAHSVCLCTCVSGAAVCDLVILCVCSCVSSTLVCDLVILCTCAHVYQVQVSVIWSHCVPVHVCFECRCLWFGHTVCLCTCVSGAGVCDLVTLCACVRYTCLRMCTWRPESILSSFRSHSLPYFLRQSRTEFRALHLSRLTGSRICLAQCPSLELHTYILPTEPSS